MLVAPRDVLRVPCWLFALRAGRLGEGADGLLLLGPARGADLTQPVWAHHRRLMDARRRRGGGGQEQRPLVTKRRWIFSGKFGFENIQGFAFMNNTDGALHNFMNMAFVTLGLEGCEGKNVGVDNGRFEVSTTILAIVYSDLVSNTGRDKIRQRFPRPNKS